ncbi:MAG: hypothetical protein QOF32_2568 [Gammaproteobacteria bacterium]|jgi:hypothetical protein|nr:hypothetical protein [Gammaproteobacteria bacterium]
MKRIWFDRDVAMHGAAAHGATASPGDTILHNVLACAGVIASRAISALRSVSSFRQPGAKDSVPVKSA